LTTGVWDLFDRTIVSQNRGSRLRERQRRDKRTSHPNDDTFHLSFLVD
jgi:hypothetical protein